MLTEQIDGVDDVTDLVPSPGVDTTGVNEPPTTADAGRLETVTVEGVIIATDASDAGPAPAMLSARSSTETLVSGTRPVTVTGEAVVAGSRAVHEVPPSREYS